MCYQTQVKLKLSFACLDRFSKIKIKSSIKIKQDDPGALRLLSAQSRPFFCSILDLALAKTSNAVMLTYLIKVLNLIRNFLTIS